MYVCEGLKLNKFRDVAVPANKDYFSRFGLLDDKTGKYSGDDRVVNPMNKIDVMADMEAYDARMQREELAKSE